MPAEKFGRVNTYVEKIATSTDIHGCFYLSNRNLHIVERVTWILLIQLALCGTVYACLNQYSRYYIRPTVMSVEKDYRSWQGVLPAGTICLANVVDEIKANKIIDGLMAESGNFTEMDREVFMSFLVAVVNATAENYEQLAEFGSEEQLQSLDLYELAMDITRPAGHRVKVTTYDPKVKIELEPIMLEKGLCYTFNTALPSVFRNNVRKETKLRKPLACRYGKQECSLKVEAFDTSISLDIHSPYEFSDVYSHEIEMDRADEVSSTYKIMETVTSETLRDLSPHQRKCLYPDEDYPAFSKSICYMKCRGKMAMDMCNCIPHFYPFLDGPKCSPSGYECLLDFKWPGWSLSLCNCTRTCVELKYTVHNIIKRNWDAGSNITFATKASFNLEIMPPKVRNRISVVFSFEDLLVSFGGAASLFLGFSFWNVVRAIYYWFNELFVYLMQFTSRRHKVKPGTVQGTILAK